MGKLKKSYSQLNLLQEKILTSFEKKTWVDFFFTSKYRYLDLQFPFYDYLRGKVFIEDIKEVFDEEVAFNFSINHLIDLLYTDFLTQIKKGVNYEDMASFLVDLKYKYLSPSITKKRVMKRVDTNLFSFETIEEEVPLSEEEQEKTVYITLRIKDSAILRGEIFLHDLSRYTADQSIQIEELIVILYTDFIAKIKDKGNNLDVMKAIINRF